MKHLHFALISATLSLRFDFCFDFCFDFSGILFADIESLIPLSLGSLTYFALASSAYREKSIDSWIKKNKKKTPEAVS